MYWGSDPRYVLDEVSRRQEELRDQARLESEARWVRPSPRRRSPAAFKLWRLHVMVWVENPRP